MARILRGVPARPRSIMARRGRLPRAAGRPPRSLRTGHQRAISLSKAHLQAPRRDARHTLEREAEGDPDIRGARSRGGLLAAAEVADGAPGQRSQTRGAVLRAAAALPRLSGCGNERAVVRSSACVASTRRIDLVPDRFAGTVRTICA